MPRTGGADQARAIVFGVGAPLEAKLPVGPKPENMDGPVPQLSAMNLAARERTDDDVIFIDEVEDFIRRLADFFSHARPRSMMMFQRFVNSRSCFFQSGSHAAS
jgi:hypothetical protein